MDKKEIIKYWTLSSDNDYETMEYLFKGKNYSWSLFVGHIVVEKLLKAYYTKNIDTNTPYIHDLLRIAEKAKLKLSEEQKNFIDMLEPLNIECRYPTNKEQLMKSLTDNKCKEILNNTKELQRWIKQKL